MSLILACRSSRQRLKIHPTLLAVEVLYRGRPTIPRLTKAYSTPATSAQQDPPATQVKIPLPSASSSAQSPETTKPKLEVRENIYTIPNLLTLSRIVACPFLGYCIVNGNFVAATSLLVYAGATDWVCGADNFDISSLTPLSCL